MFTSCFEIVIAVEPFLGRTRVLVGGHHYSRLEARVLKYVLVVLPRAVFPRSRTCRTHRCEALSECDIVVEARVESQEFLGL